jgi:hypothetical protein
MAGDNVRFSVWRMSTLSGTDDVVGGAVITGSIVYDQVQGRMQAQPSQQLLLQQGLETERTFSARVIPGTLTIYERDELEVVEPFDHPYHGLRFRVIGSRYSDFNPRDPRNYILLDLVRDVRAHANQ